MTGGLHQRARVMAHVDRAHREGLEGFNRATHSDALRELQLPAAETEQPDFDRAAPSPREVLATVGWRRIAIAALFAIAIWILTATFAVMCGGPQ